MISNMFYLVIWWWLVVIRVIKLVTCQKCGAINEENNRFCLNCGEKLSNDPSSELKEMGSNDFKDANQLAEKTLNEFKMLKD